MEQKQTQKTMAIIEEKILEEAKMKALSDDILVLKTQRCAIGFRKDEISEISKSAKKLAEELTEAMLNMFKMAVENKKKALSGSLDHNRSLYKDRNGLFAKELGEMKIRFDFLKKKEQRRSCLIERQIITRAKMARKRLAFYILRQLSGDNEDFRSVMTS